MYRLFIVGLGSNDEKAFQALKDERLQNLRFLIFRSVPDSLRGFLEKGNFQVVELENYFRETGMDLAMFKQKAAEAMETVLKKEGAAAYVVPGKFWPGDALVKQFREHMHCLGEDFRCEVLDGQDFLGKIIDFICGDDDIDADLSRGVNVLDVYSLDSMLEPFAGELLLLSMGSSRLEELAKRYLHSLYPSKHRIDILELAGEDEMYLKHTLHLGEAQNEQKEKTFCRCEALRAAPPGNYLLGDTVSFMSRLRAPEGCPWDRQQDHLSLRRYLLEEAYEVLSALNSEDPDELCEELGDLLLQIIFHSQLAAEKEQFSIWEVIDGITEKIYRRHPHVFQHENLNTAEEVNITWQEIKSKEKGKNKGNKFELPQEFPALLKAQKIQKKASELGFDWADVEGAAEKVSEELQEIIKAYRSGQENKLEEEVGDLLFSLVNVSRFLGVESELALEQSIDKFKRRFSYINRQVEKSGKSFSSFTLEELDRWWEEAKKLDNPQDNETV